MSIRKLLPFLLFAGFAVSCGGQKQTGSPNDPNEQQGNPQAQPAKSDTSSKSNKEPVDNKAGRNAHTEVPNGQDNK